MKKKCTKSDLTSIVNPSFESLVSSVYSAVLFNLGEIKVKGMDTVCDSLEMAKFNIGLLEMLEEKTKGNLTDEENSYLQSILANSRERLSEHLE
ncbi:MAG TPA: DUF1844 domain-containing protein [bacterium]|nr:DUF1844 domain-containing protein [bacterium]HPS28652.1 DUF1844 domain-containing protein [bacterium]